MYDNYWNEVVYLFICKSIVYVKKCKGSRGKAGKRVNFHLIVNLITIYL